MSDIEQALAKALEQHGLDFWVELTPDDIRHGVKEMDFDYEALAAFILATEPMQAIARQAAIGAAVERLAALPDVGSWEVSPGIRAKVWVRAEGLGSVFTAERPTIEEAVAAIAAALEAPTDD